MENGEGNDLQTQINELQKLVQLQVQAMQMQTQMLAQQNEQSLRSRTLATSTTTSTDVRQVKVPDGHYNMNLSEYRTYCKDCRDYKTLTNYTDNQVVLQMRLHMDNDLKRAIDTNYSTSWDSFTLDEAIKTVGKIVNHISNPVVYRKEFDNLYQSQDEPIREFITRLRSCAIDCNFTCPYDENHDLTDYHIINRIRCGIFDKSLQQELLQKSNELKVLPEISQFCENYESAMKDKNKLSDKSPIFSLASIDTEGLAKDEVIAAISNYKQKKLNYPNKKNLQKCNYCGYAQHTQKQNCPAQGKTCNICGKKNHFEQVCRSKQKFLSPVVISTVISICNNENRKSKLPTLKVHLKSPDSVKYQELEAVADTGAQVNVAGLSHLQLLNIHQESLYKPSHQLKHAGGSLLGIIGSYPISVQHQGKTFTTEFYFVKNVTKIYLSLDTCKQIEIIHPNFPNVNINSTINAVNTTTNNRAKLLPERPATLPFEPIEENIHKLESWLMDQFSKSTFDITSQPLPPMSGKPQKLHIIDNATPYAAHSPIPVPHHWKEEVKIQLEKDVEMGILQKVPVGEPTEWCMRMVVVPKKDGKPRRTVDFQPINKFCMRETHHTPSPFDAVSNVPQQVYKTVLDAYNGYHQVLLDEESIKLTTFITELGRYQYLRAPQGHLASGDAYTRRYDDIIADVLRKLKIIDDVLLYDQTIEEAFFHVFDYLHLCGQNGITLNPEKFKFCRREVDFAGFNITWDGYRPTENMLSALINFPMPDKPTITDIRSWFGLVHQFAPFLATAPLMEPFRDLLKSKGSHNKIVYWDSNLQELFLKTKNEICNIATQGLTFYDTNRTTIVITDWSKKGIGFVVMQQHCNCDLNRAPNCCEEGWKLAFCSSRHLTTTESNYAPIEGEALAVAWALRKARLFLLGCNHFTILVDHKPLIKIFGDKTLHEISNPRLLNFKEKTLQYSFTVQYVKGINNFANTLSRYPVGKPDPIDALQCNELEISVIDSTAKLASEKLLISLKDIEIYGNKDNQYQLLMNKIRSGTFASNITFEDPIIKKYFNVKDRLALVDNIIMYCFEDKEPRIVIPQIIRKKIIENLHAANQGATSMLSRARQAVYWPGMDKDIINHVNHCQECRFNAPSQSNEPLITAPIPEYPFQNVVADLFEIDHYIYLAYADRLTGFIELAYFPTTPNSQAIINILREFFHRWGVAEEISADGGPNLSSKEIKIWLQNWGVKLRLSSAYYPQSNGRAEAAVKSLKRLLMGNTGPKGTINTDKIAKALLQHRNTPLRGINKSPAQLALGRDLRDSLPLPRERYKISSHWAHHIRKREVSMNNSNTHIKELYDKHSKTLNDLNLGDNVLCQNTRNNKWDREGIIIEKHLNRQYTVKMKGSGRVSLRNRKHLKKLLITKPHIPLVTTEQAQQYPPLSNSNNEPMTDTMNPNPAQNSVSNNSTENMNLRRSTRTKKPPVRYIEEF